VLDAGSLLFAVLLGVSEPSRPPADATLASLNPRVLELFDREPQLKQWALRIFDRNRDGWLTLFEAQSAANEFRDIADEDGDGQVSVREYSAALDFIRVRY
jgi:hypothetical protein